MGHESAKKYGREKVENPDPINDEFGDPICIECRGPRGTSSAFCSASCRKEYRIKVKPKFARNQVFKRDKGVCASCGTDTTAFKVEILNKMQANVGYPLTSSSRPSPAMCRKLLEDPANRELLDELVKKGWPNDLRRVWWDADHVHAVADGGAMCGLENYVTLCVPCHKKKTSEDQAVRFKK